jgi:hypothetical protein
MQKLKVSLKNCHGIHLLESDLDFGKSRSTAIYAPNGTMKTSFAHTFREFAAGEDSGDQVFPDRRTERSITDEARNPIDPSDVVVILSYDEELGPTESTSTLLVNVGLRREYEALHEALAAASGELLDALGKQAGLSGSQARQRQNIIPAISPSSRQADKRYLEALNSLYEEAAKQETTPFATVPYELIFNDKVLLILQNPDLRSALAGYVTRLDELLRESRFFSRESFSYYNAEKVSVSLADNGFFAARHSLLLRGKDDEPTPITDHSQLKSLIMEEKQQITQDAGIRKNLDAVEKSLSKNKETRDFHELLRKVPELLEELSDVELLRRKLWLSYIKAQESRCADVVARYRETEKKSLEIERKAAEETTRWKHVIDIFNDRFSVPFKLIAKNHSRMVLGQDKFLELGFEFEDGAGQATVQRDDLLRVLSNGEKKALYILNVLFEVEARRASGRETLFIVDDIAESFDYKNKYAIVHYLKEMAEEENFRLVILTHNFDFFRTLESRGVVERSGCLMAERHEDRIVLNESAWMRNPFTRGLKRKFFTDGMQRIACIPFIRNILEYTKDDKDPDYLTLTSLLHWKPDTATITQATLDAIFQQTFTCAEIGAWESPQVPVVDLILAKAEEAFRAGDGANFANKIVLSIAIRLQADRHMVHAINDHSRTDGFTGNQTYKLYKAYKNEGLGSPDTLRTLDSVLLMTPENIHVNSFMYEPIIDMSDTHLRKLFIEVESLPHP